MLILSIVGSLLVGLAPSGSLASMFPHGCRIIQGLSGAHMAASLALLRHTGRGRRGRGSFAMGHGLMGGSGFAALFVG